MVLDSKLKELRDNFGILDPEDWQEIEPGWITAVPGIGPQTLNHLRLMLASRGFTLKGDETPAYWQQRLGARRGASQLAETDREAISEFTILVDTGEQHPFTFQGLTADARQNHRPLAVKTRRVPIGESKGDYSVKGMEDWCHVERKSLADVQSTVLGWGDRRENFCKTLDFLAELPSSMVVVECTIGAAISMMPSNGKKSVAENRKIFHRQVLAWMNDYRVPWLFCDDRRLAEISTLRFFERQWRHYQAELKRAAKQRADESDDL